MFIQRPLSGLLACNNLRTNASKMAAVGVVYNGEDLTGPLCIFSGLCYARTCVRVCVCVCVCVCAAAVFFAHSIAAVH